MPNFDDVINSNNITTPYIELFTLDCRRIGGGQYYFTPNGLRPDGSPIVWHEAGYTSMPITTAGWEATSDGSQTKPTVTISLVSRELLSAVLSLGDLIGSKLTRYRTFDKFLDGQPEEEYGASFAPDIFIVEQKVAHNNEYITWSLTSVIDRFGMKLPRRQILRDDVIRDNEVLKGFPGVSRYRGPR